MKIDHIMDKISVVLKRDHQATLKEATTEQLHAALGSVVMDAIADDWYNSRHANEQTRSAYYFSAEYLVGRMVYNNLFALGILQDVKNEFSAQGIDIADFEDIEDAALGNGGLGRLAACFLDSAATMDLPLMGYGLRYKYGLFKQSFSNGFQVEKADDWQRGGDPWSIRRPTHEFKIEFADQTVRAIPYDMPVIGYGTKNIGTLRLWQSEAVEDFDFTAFNNQDYGLAVLEKNAVEDITRVLYPNDSTPAGKKLRLKQQYFLSSASLQDILFRYKRENRPIEDLPKYVTIQLNDTHPTVSIPELIRLLMREGLGFDKAFELAQQTFNYTNHTVMSEALEKWDVNLFKEVLPEIFDIVYTINTKLCGELMKMGAPCERMAIVQDSLIHMANMAVYGSTYVNGVAQIHTEILKNDVLKDWYTYYPERFQNKTNGITQRRWLGLCNPELTGFLAQRLGTKDFLTDLDLLEGLNDHMTDADVKAFNEVKRAKKEQLAKIVLEREGVELPPDFMFDVQVKRMHEYKRQILNAFAILDTYYGLKEGRITDYTPTCYIFGAKAAPGYIRAKGVIKFINEIAKKVNNDPDMKDKMRVVFVQNYNCSYAEHIIPAADISEQISPAGTEASGTGNMKLMLNGAVTLGTYDGANIEIAEMAGEENEYIFGYTVDELNARRYSYDPRTIYEYDARIRRVLDSLVDGTFSDDGSGAFGDLHRSLVYGTGWGRADNYFTVLELMPYIERKMDANREYRDRMAFGRKCMKNIASAGKFSSDRTIRQYAEEIWHIEPMKMEKEPVKTAKKESKKTK
ncbi:MAG: glycogen/starch/alpha-glucan phosphorylase [Clostridia bacterium]|nr:glycogen/starch/alpha-glucan phosphorylase [Clostridia bacterium]